MRSGAEKRVAAARADSLAAAAAAESARVAAAARDSAAADTAGQVAGAATPSGSTSRPSTGAAATPASRPAAGATAPTAARPTAGTPTSGAASGAGAAESRRYGIVVGQYLNEERANTELSRLAEATGVSGRVVTSEGGEFQVVLGSFAGRAAAERKGEELISKGQVSEARVVPLPR